MLTASRKTRSRILDELIKREGRAYTEHPADRGGPTRYGVTLDTYRLYMGDPSADADDIRNLDEELARRILAEAHFDGHGFENVDDDVCYEMLLDMAVNHGPRLAAKILQKAVGAEPDGIIGPKTLRHAELILPTGKLPLHMVYERQLLYGRITRDDPSQAAFLVGWTKRCFSFLFDCRE